MGVDRNVKYGREQREKAKAEKRTLFTIDMTGPLAGGQFTLQGFLFTKDEAEELWAMIRKLTAKGRKPPPTPSGSAPAGGTNGG